MYAVFQRAVGQVFGFIQHSRRGSSRTNTDDRFIFRSYDVLHNNIVLDIFYLIGRQTSSIPRVYIPTAYITDYYIYYNVTLTSDLPVGRTYRNGQVGFKYTYTHTHTYLYAAVRACHISREIFKLSYFIFIDPRRFLRVPIKLL